VDGLPKAQQSAIERQIAIMTDPVEKMRLRLALARFEEGQGQAVQGAAVIDALYRENPAILGVVRATVDYHWRNKNAKRAVDVLEEASSRSSASYRAPFLIEATRKATEAGDYTRAGSWSATCNDQTSPIAPNTSPSKPKPTRAKVTIKVLTLYDTTIALTTATNIPVQQGTDEIAAMRRALIPVLTRVKDYSAALDQYIEILNRFPDDEALTREAALYAQQNGVAKKLHDYYLKTASDSPKDFHWPMVLARVETQMEDYPTAIASYTRAAAVRPDRPDLIKERLNLEESLSFRRSGSQRRSSDLTYRNPTWMKTGRNARQVASRIRSRAE
jgi:tetratricopeptide (TPR) repeat protein